MRTTLWGTKTSEPFRFLRSRVMRQPGCRCPFLCVMYETAHAFQGPMRKLINSGGRVPAQHSEQTELKNEFHDVPRGRTLDAPARISYAGPLVLTNPTRK